METIPLKQLTHKTGFATDPRDLKKDDKPIFISRVSGVIEKVKAFEDRKGKEQTVFIGDFIVQGADGKKYSSDKLYLFKQLEEKLSGTFTASGDKAVEFSYDVYAGYDEKSVTRYAYAAESVIKTATSDRMAKLLEESGKKPLPTVAQSKGETETKPENGKGKKAA